MPQTDYGLQSSRPGSPGLCVDARLASFLSGAVTGAVAQVSTVTVGGSGEASYTVTVTIDGADYEASYTPGGADGNDEVAAGLKAALIANANINGFAEVTVAAAVITLTARAENRAFAVAGSHADLTVATTTAAAAAGEIPFGIVVLADADNADDEGFKLPAAADFTAKVIHATPTAENNAVYNLLIKVDADGDGVIEVYSASYTADGAASAQEIVEALQAALDGQMPANTVGITEDDAKIIFTGERPGIDFIVTGTAQGTTADWAISTETALVRPALGGISCRGSVEIDKDGNAAWRGGDTLKRQALGPVWALLDAGVTPTKGNPAFYRVTAASTEQAGALRDAADGADCCLEPRLVFMESKAYTVGGHRLAKVMISGVDA